MINKKLSDENYDRLKELITILFPATAAFYAALAVIFGLSWSKEVAGVLAALAAYIGVLLRLSSARFWADRKIEDVTD